MRSLIAGALLTAAMLSTPANAQSGAPRRAGKTVSGSIGMTVTPYEADAANEAFVGSTAVGFDMNVAVWLRPRLGVRFAAGVEGFKGPDGSNGHPANGSYGVASIALALRSPLESPRPSFGVDFGLSTTFESTYSYSYTSGNTHYVYPDIDLPMRAGPFVELSLRKNSILGWFASYRQYFAGADPNDGRLRRRIMLGFGGGK
jgi:hypothetical protein